MDPLIPLPHFVRRNSALSLTELLVVTAILALLLGIGIPAMSSLTGSRHIGKATIDLVDALNTTRQIAISQNTQTRFQLFKVADHRNGDPAAFRLLRIQKFSPQSRSWEQVMNWRLLPQGISVDETSQSTLLSINHLQTESIHYQGGNTSSSVCNIVFSPNGRARLNPNATHILMVKDSRSDSDFSAVQLDPITGTTRVYRP